MAEDDLKRYAELPGNQGFPVAIARREGRKPETWIEPTMFYVWIFSAQECEWVPLAAFHTREDADRRLADYRAQYATPGCAELAGAVLELPWREFASMAVDLRLKELAEPLRRLAAVTRSVGASDAAAPLS